MFLKLAPALLANLIQGPQPGNGLPIILISSSPITAQQRKYLESDIESAIKIAERDKVQYVPLKDGHIFQFGDPLGLKRQDWFLRALNEFETMRAAGKVWFRVGDLSEQVRDGFLEWAQEKFAPMPDLGGVDFRKVHFTSVGMLSAVLDSPRGPINAHLDSERVVPPTDKILVLTEEMKEKTWAGGDEAAGSLYIQRSDYRRSVSSKALEAYFAWLQLQMDEGRAKLDEARQRVLEKQFGLKPWKVGQEYTEMSQRDQSLWRAYSRNKLFQDTGVRPEIEAGEELAKQLKVSSVRQNYMIQFFVREGQGEPRSITTEFRP